MTTQGITVLFSVKGDSVEFPGKKVPIVEITVEQYETALKITDESDDILSSPPKREGLLPAYTYSTARFSQYSSYPGHRAIVVRATPDGLAAVADKLGLA